MTDPITVPASVLAALGGLVVDDPGVAMRDPERTVWFSWHPLDGAADDDDWAGDANTGTVHGIAGHELRLPASAPALLRVLARHLGFDLAPQLRWGLVWGRRSSSWRLYLPYGGEVRFSYRWTYDDEIRHRRRVTVPALAGLNDPMEALAAVLVHVAHRADHQTPPHSPKAPTTSES